MSDVILTLRAVPRDALPTVLTECSVRRDAVGTNLANGPAWAPQVHNEGSYFQIVCPPMSLDAARAILMRLDAHEANH